MGIDWTVSRLLQPVSIPAVHRYGRIVYIPERVEEGYGYQSGSWRFYVKSLRSDDTVDAHLGKDRLEQLQTGAEVQTENMDIIITDHHQPNQTVSL
jgi:single-stranded DNA-specific DHH superfamily exonuclease